MKVISIHHYTLKPSADADEFEHAIIIAREGGLLELPGLEAFHFLKGIRGERRGSYAAIWIYASQEAWEALWGPVGSPKPKEDYPQNWKVWEDQVLAPFLSEEPDRITYTSYEEF